MTVSLPGMAKGELRASNVAPDPITQIERWIDDARSAEVRDWDAMVVATADASGAPSARMVLLRGVDQRGLRFYTNHHSAKGRDLAANPRAALVLHWRELGRQVRVTGGVTPLTSEESLEYWQSRPRASRLSAWASHQSEPIADRAALEAAVEEMRRRFGDDGDIPLPPFWGGFLVEPQEVELWQHRDDRLHDRLRYRNVSGAWVIDRLQP
jgi:pyridoxamine 5'-phosphate oxidase